MAVRNHLRCPRPRCSGRKGLRAARELRSRLRRRTRRGRRSAPSLPLVGAPRCGVPGRVPAGGTDHAQRTNTVADYAAARRGRRSAPSLPPVAETIASCARPAKRAIVGTRPIMYACRIKHILALIVFLIPLAVARAETRLRTTANRVVEGTFSSAKAYDDPFNEIELDVIVTSVEGTSQKVPA